MKLYEALSDRGLDAILEADKIGRNKLGGEYYGSSVKRLTNTGFWADITDKSGRTYKLRVTHRGAETIINFK